MNLMNISVLIFPQTTRELFFDPKKFNTLGIKLAKRAKVPVIPIAVKTDACGMGRWAMDFGRIDPSKPVRVSFGEPVHINGNGKTEHRLTIDFIGSKLDGWRSKAEIRCPKSDGCCLCDLWFCLQRPMVSMKHPSNTGETLSANNPMGMGGVSLSAMASLVCGRIDFIH